MTTIFTVQGRRKALAIIPSTLQSTQLFIVEYLGQKIYAADKSAKFCMMAATSGIVIQTILNELQSLDQPHPSGEGMFCIGCLEVVQIPVCSIARFTCWSNASYKTTIM